MRCIAIPNPFVALERVRDADLVLSAASQLRLADALSQLSISRPSAGRPNGGSR
jgi:hypothetical protein